MYVYMYVIYIVNFNTAVTAYTLACDLESFTLTCVALLQAIKNIQSRNTRELFGAGNFESLKQSIKSQRQSISAVFVSIDVLNSAQLQTLQNAFGVPVYDRLDVLPIF